MHTTVTTRGQTVVPAEIRRRYGIEEGSRIASINGVDVRGTTSRDNDDFVFRTSNICT